MASPWLLSSLQARPLLRCANICVSFTCNKSYQLPGKSNFKKTNSHRTVSSRCYGIQTSYAVQRTCTQTVQSLRTSQSCLNLHHNHPYSTDSSSKDKKQNQNDDDYIYDDSDDEFVDQFEVLPGDHPNTPVPGRELHHPEKGDLVYYGSLEKYVKGLKIFSFSTSGIILASQPLMWNSLADSSALGKTIFFGTMFFFSLGTPVLLHLLSRKYVIDMYYNAKTDVFTATTYSLFGTTKVHTFKSENVYVPDLPQAFVFMIVNQTTKLYLDPLLLRSRYAYIKLKKYDQPMSLDFVEERMKQRILEKEKEEKKK